MKIAVVTDLHANLPALRCALDAIRREGFDLIYHCGDVIGIGPHPAECLDLLLNTKNVRFIMGNHDAFFAFGIPPEMSAGENDRWTHSQLSPSLRVLMADWPFVETQVFEGVEVAFVHYGLQPSGRDFLGIVPRPTPPDLDGLFAGLPAHVLFYGHHHLASDLSGLARYVNPGSLGCFDRAIARYSILECRNRQFRLEHRAVPYADGGLFADFERRGVPERDFIYKAFFGGRFKQE